MVVFYTFGCRLVELCFLFWLSSLHYPSNYVGSSVKHTQTDFLIQQMEFNVLSLCSVPNVNVWGIEIAIAIVVVNWLCKSFDGTANIQAGDLWILQNPFTSCFKDAKAQSETTNDKSFNSFKHINAVAPPMEQPNRPSSISRPNFSLTCLMTSRAS